jgi:hypothetical protein
MTLDLHLTTLPSLVPFPPSCIYLEDFESSSVDERVRHESTGVYSIYLADRAGKKDVGGYFSIDGI